MAAKTKTAGKTAEKLNMELVNLAFNSIEDLLAFDKAFVPTITIVDGKYVIGATDRFSNLESNKDYAVTVLGAGLTEGTSKQGNAWKALSIKMKIETPDGNKSANTLMFVKKDSNILFDLSKAVEKGSVYGPDAYMLLTLKSFGWFELGMSEVTYKDLMQFINSNVKDRKFKLAIIERTEHFKGVEFHYSRPCFYAEIK